MDLDPKKIKNDAIAVLVNTIFGLHDAKNPNEILYRQRALKDWKWDYNFFMKETDPEFLREVQTWTEGWRI